MQHLLPNVHWTGINNIYWFPNLCTGDERHLKLPLKHLKGFSKHNTRSCGPWNQTYRGNGTGSKWVCTTSPTPSSLSFIPFLEGLRPIDFSKIFKVFLGRQLQLAVPKEVKQQQRLMHVLDWNEYILGYHPEKEGDWEKLQECYLQSQGDSICCRRSH